MHRVLVETEPGKWQIIGDTGQPLELLQLDVAKDHAIGMQSANMMIVDEAGSVATKYENYTPLPQEPGEPISEENAKIRDRWLKSIILWLIPRSLAESYETEEAQEEIRKALIEVKAEIAIRPDGCVAIIYRDGEPLARWCC